MANATPKQPHVLVVTGGLITSQERSAWDVARKWAVQWAASEHAWLDTKIKLVAAEPLLAWARVRRERFDARYTVDGWLNATAQVPEEPPSLTEVVLTGLLSVRGISFDTLTIGELFGSSRTTRNRIESADCVWLSTTYLHDLSELEPVLVRIRRPGLAVVLGGALVNLLAPDWEGIEGVDVVAVGYGERTVDALVGWMRSGYRTLEAPNGGRLERRRYSRFLFGGMQEGESLDVLPRPDWAAAERHHGRRFPMISYESVRGCPYRCAFCNYPYLFDDNHFRYRSAERIATDWSYYAEVLGVRTIVCLDSLFTVPKKRLIRLCELLLERKLDLRWTCYARADDLTDESVVALMRAAGAIQAQIGMESGDAGQLERMNKRCSVRNNQQALENCSKHGIPTAVSLIVGYPGETAKTLDRTFRALAEAPPDFYFLATFSTRAPGVPVLEPENRARLGLEVTTNRRSMAPYWRHRSMSCEDVGNHVRALDRRLMENAIALNATLFYPWMLGYERGDRETWLALQTRTIERGITMRPWFDRLHRWVDKRLTRDVQATLPAPGER